ncbi:MAG: bifunctional glycosyltransferase family 2/GtrA family protein [Clostridia bacterium]|nr:bifunctional glycosyltransferase family 2/GtrA family protein [Clostridia bacterium]
MNAILIPAYKPDEKLIALCEKLLTHEDLSLVVVDDGSGAEFKPIFDALDERVHLISYPVNKGKGGALKTGIKYIYENLPECERLVTADADGQHRYEDIQKVIAKSVECPGTLVLGYRRFDESNVPARSRFGNAMTRGVFRLVSGAKVYDTQTGLRGFDRPLMECFLNVRGERYEYEMNMLLEAAHRKIPIHEVTIKTVYLDENESSHFNPLKDSAKIYYCLLKYFIKFMGSSLLAFCIEYLLLLLFEHFFITPGKWSLDLANGVARIVSATINFSVNYVLVFRSHEKVWKTFIKYACLAVCLYFLDTEILKLLNHQLGLPLWLAKPITETTIFLINFPIQKRFIYKADA